MPWSWNCQKNFSEKETVLDSDRCNSPVLNSVQGQKNHHLIPISLKYVKNQNNNNKSINKDNNYSNKMHKNLQ